MGDESRNPADQGDLNNLRRALEQEKAELRQLRRESLDATREEGRATRREIRREARGREAALGGDDSSGPGFVRGRHYTEYVEEVKELRRSGREDEAESLLLELVEATEAEAKDEGLGVAPGYYEQLAILYKTRGDGVREVAILERFAQQKHAPGVMPPRLLERLEKARARLGTARD